MRRPRWIAALVLALAIAGGFAALGQWQLERAVTSGETINGQTETVIPLGEFATPQAPVFETQAAQRASTSGHFVASGYEILGNRLNDGTPGYWVIGQFAVDQPGDTYLAVALGWTPDGDLARRTAEQLAANGGSVVETIEGRYLPTEAPNADDAKGSGAASGGVQPLLGGSLQTAMSVASLVNQWPEFDSAADIYGGYLVLDQAPDALQPIASPEPDRSVQLNWLNIFYAAEWVVFAGFAVYLWYRLVRDAWERENEDDDDDAQVV